MKMSIIATRYALLVALANCFLYHMPLFIFAASTLDLFSWFAFRVLAQLLLIVFTVTAIFLYAISLVSLRCLSLISICMCLCNAIAIYFVSTYGAFLDKAMMGNVANTQMAEVAEYVGAELVLYFLVLGVVPAVFLSRIKITSAPKITIISHIGVSVMSCLLIIYVNGSVLLWFDQYSRRLGGMMLPWSYAINSFRSQGEKLIGNSKRHLLPAPSSIDAQKSLVVLIIGETARANNFTAYGYERETHPMVSGTSAAFLQNTTACASYTVASIRCMLSHDGLANSAYEPLPTYLQRHGVHVIWRTNNWGEPELGLKNYTMAAQLRTECTGIGCDFDEVLLQGLKSELVHSEHDKMLLVLHTKGSHGPAYHKRYPDNHEHYKPVCKSVDLSKCSDAELINVYDNTIIYTDYFIASTIEMIREIPKRSVALMYISDHGESLGEYGLYLHGTPRLIAPDYQLQIPFVVWMSSRFKQLNRLDESHFNQDRYSHANVFHSILGALGIRNQVYDEALDIFQ